MENRMTLKHATDLIRRMAPLLWGVDPGSVGVELQCMVDSASSKVEEHIEAKVIIQLTSQKRVYIEDEEVGYSDVGGSKSFGETESDALDSLLYVLRYRIESRIKCLQEVMNDLPSSFKIHPKDEPARPTE